MGLAGSVDGHCALPAPAQHSANGFRKEPSFQRRERRLNEPQRKP